MLFTSHLTAKCVLLVISLLVSACLSPLPPAPVITLQGYPQIDQLIANLSEADPATRGRAAYALGELGADAVPAIPNLLQAVRDPEPVVRLIVAFGLGKIGASADLVVPALRKMAVNPTELPEVRYSAIRSLGNFEDPDTTTSLILQSLLTDSPNDNIRLASLNTLAQIAPMDGLQVQTLLVDRLTDPNWYVARQVRELLSAQGQQEVGFLWEELQAAGCAQTGDCVQKHAWGRRSALVDLLVQLPTAAPKLGAEISPTSPAANLLKSLSIIALGQMGDVGLEQMLNAALSGQLMAIEALPLFGEKAVPGLSTLALKPDSSLLARNLALKSLGSIGAPALDALRTIYGNAPADQHLQIVNQALIPMGEAGLPLLLDILADASSKREKQAIVTALGQMALRPATVIPILLEISQDRQAEAEVRSAALDVLGNYGTQAADAIPVLISLIQTETGAIQTSAIKSLGALGAGHPEAVTGLLLILAQCMQTAIPASQALGQMESLAQEAISGLVDAILCPDAKIQVAAIEALGLIGATSGMIVDRLADKLLTGEQPVAKSAATALGRIGPGALASLQEILTASPSADVRQLAADGLVTMGGVAAPGLAQILHDAQWSGEVYSATQYALGKIGRPAVPFLIESLRKGDTSSRQRLFDTLLLMGPHAIQGILWGVQDAELEVDEARLNALFGKYVANGDASQVSAGLAVPEAIPFLISGLSNSSRPEVRREAARALGFIGPAAAEAIPRLAQILVESNPVLGCDATFALLLIGTDRLIEAAPAVANALLNSRDDHLCEANSDKQRMLRIRQPDGYQLLLAEILASPDQTTVPFSHLLIHVLVSPAAGSEMANTALVDALAKPPLRRLAAEALGKIGSLAHPLLIAELQAELPLLDVPGRDEALAGFDRDRRRSLVYALYRSVDGLGTVTASVLRRIADDEAEDDPVRRMAARALMHHNWLTEGRESVGDGVSCPRWAAMNNSGVALTGFDPYLERCVYAKPAEAPTWKEVYQWLVKKMKG